MQVNTCPFCRRPMNMAATPTSLTRTRMQRPRLSGWGAGWRQIRTSTPPAPAGRRLKHACALRPPNADPPDPKGKAAREAPQKVMKDKMAGCAQQMGPLQSAVVGGSVSRQQVPHGGRRGSRSNRPLGEAGIFLRPWRSNNASSSWTHNQVGTIGKHAVLSMW